MPKNSSAARRQAARATAAAEGISYTAALRRLDATREAGSGQLPPDPAAAGGRVIDCGELAARTGCWLADDGCGDLIRNGIWGRASASDLEELGVAEHWGYAAVAAGWTESCRTFLASRGATWDPQRGPWRGNPHRPCRAGRRVGRAALGGGRRPVRRVDRRRGPRDPRGPVPRPSRRHPPVDSARRAMDPLRDARPRQRRLTERPDLSGTPKAAAKDEVAAG